MSDEKNKPGADQKTAPVLFEKLDQAASQQGLQHYVDPDTGYLVMTTFFLKNRGYCCENNCRHCPYRKRV